MLLERQGYTCSLEDKMMALTPSFNRVSKESHQHELTFGHTAFSNVNIIPYVKHLHRGKAHFKHKTDGKLHKVWLAQTSGSLVPHKLPPPGDSPRVQ